MFAVKLQRFTVSLAATHGQERQMKFPPFKNFTLWAGDAGGSTQLPQVPQVFGQDSETPTKLQRKLVDLAATHVQKRLILSPVFL